MASRKGYKELGWVSQEDITQHWKDPNFTAHHGPWTAPTSEAIQNWGGWGGGRDKEGICLMLQNSSCWRVVHFVLYLLIWTRVVLLNHPTTWIWNVYFWEGVPIIITCSAARDTWSSNIILIILHITILVCRKVLYWYSSENVSKIVLYIYPQRDNYLGFFTALQWLFL